MSLLDILREYIAPLFNIAPEVHFFSRVKNGETQNGLLDPEDDGPTHANFASFYLSPMCCVLRQQPPALTSDLQPHRAQESSLNHVTHCKTLLYVQCDTNNLKER